MPLAIDLLESPTEPTISNQGITQQARGCRRVFKRRAANSAGSQEVRPGASYRRKHTTNLVETAQVLEICEDHEGIPHVRFELSFGWPRRMPVAAQSRMLSLHEFSVRYCERVS